MKEIWVLSVRTSLPYECVSKDMLGTDFFAFENFSDARNAMRDTIKELAFSENAMFDGAGKIIHLNDYINDMDDAEDANEDDYEDDYFLSKSVMIKIQDAFLKLFKGEVYDFELAGSDYTDYMISVNSTFGIEIVGDDDGPCNGYEPYISTNAFSMKEEKDYYLYIDDLLGQEYSSELYIDLKKVELK